MTEKHTTYFGLVKGKPRCPKDLSDRELAGEILKTAIIMRATGARPFIAGKEEEFLKEHAEFRLLTGCDLVTLAREAVKDPRTDLLTYMVGKYLLWYDQSRDPETWRGFSGLHPQSDLEFAEAIEREFDKGWRTATYQRVFGRLLEQNSPNETLKSLHIPHGSLHLG